MVLNASFSPLELSLSEKRKDSPPVSLASASALESAPLVMAIECTVTWDSST